MYGYVQFLYTIVPCSWPFFSMSCTISSIFQHVFTTFSPYVHHLSKPQGPQGGTRASTPNPGAARPSCIAWRHGLAWQMVQKIPTRWCPTERFITFSLVQIFPMSLWFMDVYGRCIDILTMVINKRSHNCGGTTLYGSKHCLRRYGEPPSHHTPVVLPKVRLDP